MILRPFLYDDTACASYLFGCLSRSALAVVDPHAELVGEYLDAAERVGAPIVAVFETHLQADHLRDCRSWLARRARRRMSPTEPASILTA